MAPNDLHRVSLLPNHYPKCHPMLFDRQINPDVRLVYLNVYHLCLMGAVKAHSHARCLPRKFGAHRTPNGFDVSGGSEGSNGSIEGNDGTDGTNVLFLFRALRSSALYMSKLVQRRIRGQQRKAERDLRGQVIELG